MDGIKIFLTNLGRYNQGILMGEWVRLPVPAEKLDEVLERIGINGEYEEYFITDYEASFANLNLSEYTSIEALNSFAERLDEMESWEVEKLAAVLEYETVSSITDIMDIIDHLDDFDILADVEDDEGLGRYYAEEFCTLDGVPEHLRGYFKFDFEGFGRDIRLESVGCYTSYGYVMDNR